MWKITVEHYNNSQYTWQWKTVGKSKETVRFEFIWQSAVIYMLSELQCQKSSVIYDILVGIVDLQQGMLSANLCVGCGFKQGMSFLFDTGLSYIFTQINDKLVGVQIKQYRQHCCVKLIIYMAALSDITYHIDDSTVKYHPYDNWLPCHTVSKLPQQACRFFRGMLLSIFLFHIYAPEINIQIWTNWCAKITLEVGHKFQFKHICPRSCWSSNRDKYLFTNSSRC